VLSVRTLGLGHFSLIVLSFFILSLGLFSNPNLSFGEFPAYELTENDMEWCEEVFPQYEALGLQWFLENYHYSIKARVCGSLYEDPIWEEAVGEDRLKKLQERSNYYLELEIKESEEEAKVGIDDPTPVAISQPEPTSSIKVSTDTSSYKKGDVVVISGSVVNPQDNDVTVRVTNPRNISVYQESLSLKSDDTFSDMLIAGDSSNWIAGTFIVKATHNDESTKTSFSFIDSTPPKVPDWVRNIFIWFAEDRISEDELLEAIQFLIDQGILESR